MDDPRTQSSWDSTVSQPGDMKRAEGRVHFAGEHTSTHSQGYLNGGVESGERAAREVMAALGVTRR